MNAVIVTFHFLAPKWPCDEALRAHQTLLERLPGLEASLALDNRTEIAFLLTFEEQSALDAYFNSDEFRALSTQPGCNDVFVKEFNVFSIPDDQVVLEPPPARAMESTVETPA